MKNVVYRVVSGVGNFVTWGSNFGGTSLKHFHWGDLHIWGYLKYLGGPSTHLHTMSLLVIPCKHLDLFFKCRTKEASSSYVNKEQ